ncbi:MAG: radical SAM protein, partial [Candidatus Bathyarchaeota archaeon]|nr:radical SAM protein [Candidatus Bathyarchaeota archaeon]
MKFIGVQKISLIDFPDRMATVLFTPGCNLRCPFCHNWRIIINPRPPFLNQEKAIRMLEARRKFIDAVVITGGEPT